MKHALLLILLAAPVCAQQSAPASTAPAPTSALVTAPVSTATPSFLATRGIVTSDELADVLGAQLTPEKRAKFDEALAKRNAALARANEELSATLRELLAATDEGLAKRADESAQAKRMERLKRLQPARYQELMNRKKATATAK